jgi:hypothetical protein
MLVYFPYGNARETAHFTKSDEEPGCCGELCHDRGAGQKVPLLQRGSGCAATRKLPGAQNFSESPKKPDRPPDHFIAPFCRSAKYLGHVCPADTPQQLLA